MQTNHLNKIIEIVGTRYVLTSNRKTEPYRTGFRHSTGEACAVIRPGTLLEFWHTIQACIEYDAAIIIQAANTGLTAGSTPAIGYNRDIVIINTLRLNKIHIISGAQQIISFPGATLFDLESLLTPYNRQPHSIIGSSCIGASIIGGICNNSGGSLVKHGPAYTELSLFCRLDATGKLVLVNKLGIDLGSEPEEILRRLETGDFSTTDISNDAGLASDHEYSRWIRDVDQNTPARFNADKRRLMDASGCAGKISVFAVRLDTFEAPTMEKTFYIGTNSTESLTKLRREILNNFKNLPTSAEYMHQDMFRISEEYGKDTTLLLDYFGTKFLPTFFSIKKNLTLRLNKFSFLPTNIADKLLQYTAMLFPNPIPKRLRIIRDNFEHHLILKMSDHGIEEAGIYLKELSISGKIEYIYCSEYEEKMAFLNRFAAAGAAIRYQIINQEKAEEVLALDIALKRNEREWFEILPKEIEDKVIKKLYYGHFLCHVFHQDYVVKKGVDINKLKYKMLKLLNQREAEYPAEHNVGHLYTAKPDLRYHYKTLDPTNTFNPGIGKMSKRKNYS